MGVQVIPVAPKPSTQFTVDLDGETVDLTIRWNSTAEQWDPVGVTFTTTLNGVVLVAGVDLLAPYAVRELGQLWLVDLEAKLEEPGFDDFGDRFQLLYVER